MENLGSRSGISFEPKPIDTVAFGQTNVSGYGAPRDMLFRKGPWDKQEVARIRTVLCFEVARNFNDAVPEESASIYARLPDNVLREVQIKTDALVQKRGISAFIGVAALIAGVGATGLGTLTDVFATAAQTAVPLGAGILGAIWEGRSVYSINKAIGAIEKDVMEYIKTQPKIMSVYPHYFSNTPECIIRPLAFSRK